MSLLSQNPTLFIELYEKILAKIVDFACIKGTKLPDGIFRLVQSGKEILSLP